MINSNVLQWALDGAEGVCTPAEVEGTSTACSLGAVLVAGATCSVELDEGRGGGSGGLILETKPSACHTRHSMNLGSCCISLVSVRPSFNSVPTIFLCFKQNQAVKLISVSMKVPDTI